MAKRVEKIKTFLASVFFIPVVIGYGLAGVIRDGIVIGADRLRGANNGVDDKIVSTKRIDITGLENEITKPVPMPGDLKWSKAFHAAVEYRLVEAMEESVANNRHWRTWFLLNRPAHHSSVIMTHESWGFRGNVVLSQVFNMACRNDNVTAAYHFLKFAEVKPTYHGGSKGTVDDKTRDREVLIVAMMALPGAARHGADKIFKLTLASCGPLDTIEQRTQEYISGIQYLKKAAIAAVQTRRFDYLDAFLAKGLPGAVLVDACRESVAEEFTFGGAVDKQSELTPPERASFMGWLAERGLTPEGFAVEIARREAEEAVRRTQPRQKARVTRFE